MSVSPSPNGFNGRDRDPRGRFTAGNPGGPDNPFSRKVGELRATLFRAVTVGDLRAVVKALVTAAKGGDVSAARLVLSYTLGEPQPFDLLERIEALEQESNSHD